MCRLLPDDRGKEVERRRADLPRKLRAETKNLLGVEDGPSAALLRFMEALGVLGGVGRTACRWVPLGL